MPDSTEIANFLIQNQQYSESTWNDLFTKVVAEAQRLIQTGKSQRCPDVAAE